MKGTVSGVLEGASYLVPTKSGTIIFSIQQEMKQGLKAYIIPGYTGPTR